MKTEERDFKIILDEKIKIKELFTGAKLVIMHCPPDINPEDRLRTFDHPEELDVIIDPQDENGTFIYLKKEEELITQFLKNQPDIISQIFEERIKKEQRQNIASLANAIANAIEEREDVKEKFLNMGDEPKYWN